MEVNLFCLPFAGGSRYSYRGYINLAPPFLKVIPIEIPGRGARAAEPPMNKLSQVADDAFQQLRSQLDKPYMIYGHSMGGLLGYLLTKRIIKEGLNQPMHLFFTGCVGPSRRYRDLVDHELPKDDFFQKIKKLGGSSEEIFKEQALMDFFEPILRADFEAVSSFQYQEGAPFNIPISIIIGTDENATVEEAMAWQKETLQPVEVHQLQGDHFFIQQNEREIVDMIINKLETKILI